MVYIKQTFILLYIHCNHTSSLYVFIMFLNSYTNYCDRPISLPDVLSLALNFIGSRIQPQTETDGAGLGPTPRSGSSFEFSDTEACLRQWKNEVESDLSG